MTDLNTPNEGGPVERDEQRPADEASSYDIQPPPTEDGEVPWAPDASDAPDETTDDRPGANDTGVGA